MDRLNSYIDGKAEALVRRLRKLVSFPTVNPPGRDYAGMTAFLTQELKRTGLSARRYAIPKALLARALPPDQLGFPRFNVLGKRKVPGAKKTIHFNAHYDVVPVSGKWTHADPFSGAVDRGWIYGRGTADMKGSIASLLCALDALQATGTKPRMNLEVSFTADEETDSYLGARWLVKEGPIDPDYAVVMEGGERDSICCGHNGTLWLEVRVHGRAAHGSLPQEGVNALEKMSALVIELQGYKRQIAARHFKSPDGTVLRPTVNLGGVFDCGPGAKINTVPANASFSIDRRVLAGEDPREAEKDLRAYLAAAARRIPQCVITVSKVSENFSCFSKPTGPFFQAMADSVARVRRSKPAFIVTPSFNDVHFFAHHLKIPALGYGPGGEDYHAVDERARVKDLVEAAKIYAGLIASFEG